MMSSGAGLVSNYLSNDSIRFTHDVGFLYSFEVTNVYRVLEFSRVQKVDNMLSSTTTVAKMIDREQSSKEAARFRPQPPPSNPSIAPSLTHRKRKATMDPPCRPSKRHCAVALNDRKRKATTDLPGRPRKIQQFEVLEEDQRFVVPTRAKRRRRNPPIQWDGRQAVDEVGRVVFRATTSVTPALIQRKRKATADLPDRPTKLPAFDLIVQRFVSTGAKRRRRNPPIQWERQGQDVVRVTPWVAPPAADKETPITGASLVKDDDETTNPTVAAATAHKESRTIGASRVEDDDERAVAAARAERERAWASRHIRADNYVHVPLVVKVARMAKRFEREKRLKQRSQQSASLVTDDDETATPTVEVDVHEKASPVIGAPLVGQDLVTNDDSFLCSSDEDTLTDEGTIVGIHFVDEGDDNSTVGPQIDVTNDEPQFDVTNDDERVTPPVARASREVLNLAIEGFQGEGLGTIIVNGVRRSRRLNPMERLGSIRVDGNRRSARLRRATNS